MPDLPPLPPPGGSPPEPFSPIGGPPLDAGAGTRRRVLVWVGVGTAVLLVGVLAGFVWASQDAEPERVAVELAPTTSTTGGDASTSTTDPDQDSDEPVDEDPDADSGSQVDADAQAVIDELSDFVAEQRGKPFKDPVVVELLGEGDFQERLLEDFEESVDDLRLLEKNLLTLGLVERDQDIVEGLRELLSVGVLGFYDPETDALVVRGTDFTPYTKISIVHELVHAYDDQWFNLHREELEDAKDESAFGFSALVEGNARRVENAYRDSLSREERSQATREELAFGMQMDLDPRKIPMVLVEFLLAPYELGEPMVDLLADDGGEDRIDEAYGDPPPTSSVVMHPERYLNGWEAVDVAPPPAPDGAEVFDDGMFGEVVLTMVLRDVVGTREALRAASAWAGDWFVSWDEGDDTCLRVDFATFGRASQVDRFEDALIDWADEQPDASVRAVDDLLRLTACG